MFLFWGYNFMSAGIATTLHFTYPVFVTLIMLLFSGKDILDYLDGDRIGNLRGGTSFDR